MKSREFDEIRIEGLEVFAHHGVYPEETKNGQTFFVNATLYTDTKMAGMKDDLTLSTNYGTVCNEIHDFLTEHTYQLLEAAVENLAHHLLLTFPLVKQLDLELQKPQAPIQHPFHNVSVKIHRGWKKAAISFGSNMGDKEQFIKDALSQVEAEDNIRMTATSDFITTEPYGGVEQDVFLNGACVIETLFDPEELLHFLQSLEQKAGRERLVHWGPRTLDLDIIFYEEEVIRTKDLVVPHPDMQNRDFVLRPLSQIAPGWMHPIYQMSVAHLRERLNQKSF